MRKTSTGTFGTILTLLILALSVSADPIFTGDVPADFTARDVVIIPDRADVGTLPGIFELSGWDMADVYFDYDHATDVLYVGVDCFGICGDADGDGDPGGTSDELDIAGGEDFADFGESESFAFLIDTDMTVNMKSSWVCLMTMISMLSPSADTTATHGIQMVSTLTQC